MKKMFKVTMFKKIFFIMLISFLCVETMHIYLDYKQEKKEKLIDTLESPFLNINGLSDSMRVLYVESLINSTSDFFNNFNEKQYLNYGHLYITDDKNNITYEYHNKYSYTNGFFYTETDIDGSKKNEYINLDLRNLDTNLIENIEKYLLEKASDEYFIIETDYLTDTPTIERYVYKTYDVLTDEISYNENTIKYYTPTYLKIDDWIVFGDSSDPITTYLKLYRTDSLYYDKTTASDVKTGEFKTYSFLYEDMFSQHKSFIENKKNAIDLGMYNNTQRYAFISDDKTYFMFEFDLTDEVISRFDNEKYCHFYTFAWFPGVIGETALSSALLAKGEIYVVAFLLTIIVSLLVSYIFTRRIKIIKDKTLEISKNNFNVMLDEKSNDELGELSKSINVMSNTLQDTFDKLHNEIEKVKELESLRKDFINQFTHEMKTPLGIINGYSELLEETESEEERERYLDIINKETVKINDLVQGMLRLSRLEAGKVELNKEVLDLEDIVTEVIDEFEVLLMKKNIKVDVNIIDKHLIGDKQQIVTVLRNFISNAIKHTESKIVITIDKGVKVFNEGKPIEEEKLERIWYTFVTHDKSGTGLGLAIVRSILELHNYSYGVTNKDNGVEFYFCE